MSNKVSNSSSQESTEKRRIVLLSLIIGGLVSIVVVGGGGYIAVKNGWLTISQGDGGTAITGTKGITQSGTGGTITSAGTDVIQNTGNTGLTEVNKGTKTEVSGGSSIGTIDSKGTVNIYYTNDKLPGFFPGQDFKAPPSDLSKYKTANLLSQDMVGLGENYASFGKGTVFISGQQHEMVFKVRGDQQERRVGFKLSGLQKAVLLQFGLQDLSVGTTNLTYRVKISADGKLLWGGECRYGQQQQLLSVPLDIPGAKSLVIEYSVIDQGGLTQATHLYFTKAELLSE